jgi:hypothetical protein
MFPTGEPRTGPSGGDSAVAAASTGGNFMKALNVYIATRSLDVYQRQSASRRFCSNFTHGMAP